MALLLGRSPAHRGTLALFPLIPQQRKAPDDGGPKCLQECVRALTEAHYVDSNTFGIPKAEQDPDGELLLGKCKQCDATRLLSSLAEHEAICRPEPVPVREPPAAASLPSAAEGLPSVSQVQGSTSPA